MKEHYGGKDYTIWPPRHIAFTFDIFIILLLREIKHFSFMSSNSYLLVSSSANRPARKRLRRENCLGCAQNPQRQVHALLGRRFRVRTT